MNVKVIHTKNLRWVDVVNPGEEELKFLKSNFKFHPLDHEDIVSISQRTKIEDREDYHFAVLLFPVYNRETKIIRPSEVDFFVGSDYLVTVHDGSMHTMNSIVASVADNDVIRNNYMAKSSGFLFYQILESLFRRSFPMLDHISKDMNDIEAKIFSDTSIGMLEKISLMKRNIIDFRRIMKTHHLVIKKMINKKDSYITFNQSRNYYGNLLEHTEHIWDILAIQKETIESLQESNQSLATNKLNEITRVITILSGLFLPATFVMFAFGLSTKHIPLIEHPYSFWLTLALAFTFSSLMLIYFKNKRWF